MLYPLDLIARHLRKKPADMANLIELHGLPVVNVPAKTKPVRKVMLSAYHRWICEHSENAQPSLQDVKSELEALENPPKKGGKAA